MVWPLRAIGQLSLWTSNPPHLALTQREKRKEGGSSGAERGRQRGVRGSDGSWQVDLFQSELPSLLPFPRDDGWALGTAGQGTGASGWVCGAECLDDVAISNNQLILCSDVCQWHGQGVASNQTRAPDSGFVLLTSYDKCFCAWLEFFKRIQKSKRVLTFKLVGNDARGQLIESQNRDINVNI